MTTARQQPWRERAAVDQLPLSLNQEFLCMFANGSDKGPFGSRYHIIQSRRLTGPVDETALRAALFDLVDRHEALRTRIVRDAEPRYQQVFAASPPHLEVRRCPGVPPDERAQRVEEFLVELESGTVDADAVPQMRAVLMYFDPEDAVVALMTHHTAADGFSLPVIGRDLALLYAARRAGTEPDLPPARQYREFVAWERGSAASASMTAARTYWERVLAGARLTALRADHPRSARLPAVTAANRFVLPPETAAAVTRLAKRVRCSPFMVLLAAYCRLVHRLTGATDIVVPTHTPGRANGLFDDTVGSFFNFLPLRIRLRDGQRTADLLRHTRDTCLAAYAHDVPSVHVFTAAPDLMATAMSDERAPVTFQAMPVAPPSAAAVAGGVAFDPIQRPRTGFVPTAAQLPDGALWTLSFGGAGDLKGNLAYRTDRFDHRTVTSLIDEYRDTLDALVADRTRG
ncbi:condensation domain-containing protein [Rhizomonospora bruguierae]|uniref:condensation domain-containing protein n=1 Tax=Rhizomonospora bruguierae TaxID=1581705 RepID=UPI001BCAF900|nr:condensation domain-containing protein [Micromonospora sp. NBRC 107566]